MQKSMYVPAISIYFREKNYTRAINYARGKDTLTTAAIMDLRDRFPQYAIEYTVLPGYPRAMPFRDADKNCEIMGYQICILKKLMIDAPFIFRSLIQILTRSGDMYKKDLKIIGVVRGKEESCVPSKPNSNEIIVYLAPCVPLHLFSEN